MPARRFLERFESEVAHIHAIWGEHGRPGRVERPQAATVAHRLGRGALNLRQLPEVLRKWNNACCPITSDANEP